MTGIGRLAATLVKTTDKSTMPNITTITNVCSIASRRAEHNRRACDANQLLGVKSPPVVGDVEVGADRAPYLSRLDPIFDRLRGSPPTKTTNYMIYQYRWSVAGPELLGNQLVELRQPHGIKLLSAAECLVTHLHRIGDLHKTGRCPAGGVAVTRGRQYRSNRSIQRVSG